MLFSVFFYKLLSLFISIVSAIISWDVITDYFLIEQPVSLILGFFLLSFFVVLNERSFVQLSIFIIIFIMLYTLFDNRNTNAEHASVPETRVIMKAPGMLPISVSFPSSAADILITPTLPASTASGIYQKVTPLITHGENYDIPSILIMPPIAAIEDVKWLWGSHLMGGFTKTYNYLTTVPYLSGDFIKYTQTLSPAVWTGLGIIAGLTVVVSYCKGRSGDSMTVPAEQNSQTEFNAPNNLAEMGNGRGILYKLLQQRELRNDFVMSNTSLFTPRAANHSQVLSAINVPPINVVIPIEPLPAPGMHTPSTVGLINRPRALNNPPPDQDIPLDAE